MTSVPMQKGEPMKDIDLNELEKYQTKDELKGYIKQLNDRDCKTCVYARTPDNPYDNGCTAWECEYINRRDAIRAYHEISTLIEVNKALQKAKETEEA